MFDAIILSLQAKKKQTNKKTKKTNKQNKLVVDSAKCGATALVHDAY